MDVEVAADLAAAEAGAQQQLRRAEGAAGDDRRPPGAHRVAAARDAVAPPSGRRPTHSTPTARPSSTSIRRASTPARSRAPAAHRPRQVADVHAALGVDLAAEGAGAALDAVAGVAGDRPAGGAERRRPLHRQLAVAAHPLGVERRHPQELLGLGEVGVEVAGPARRRSASRQSSSTGSGARKQVPELITVVPPTASRHRHRDRRAALGDRQAGVAVERGDRLELAPRVVVAVEAARRPRARSRRGRPRPAAAAATRRRRRSRRSPRRIPRPRRAGSVSPSEPAGSGSEPSASRQLVSKPIRSSTSGGDRVAEGGKSFAISSSSWWRPKRERSMRAGSPRGRPGRGG